MLSKGSSLHIKNWKFKLHQILELVNEVLWIETLWVCDLEQENFSLAILDVFRVFVETFDIDFNH
jgi:hypothetical protein